MKRTRRRGLPPDVAVALGSRGLPEAVPAPAEALSASEPPVRGQWMGAGFTARPGQA